MKTASFFSRKTLWVVGLIVLTSLILAACSAQPGGMKDSDMGGDAPSVPAGVAYLDGKEIRFIHTETSDADVAKLLSEMMDSPVIYVPELAQAPDALLADVYVFTNGVEGMGPFGFQPDIFVDPPGTPGYRPLRRVILATWNDGVKARELKSLSELQEAETAGELVLEQPGVVVNMPFITWPDGSR